MDVRVRRNTGANCSRKPRNETVTYAERQQYFNVDPIEEIIEPLYEVDSGFEETVEPRRRECVLEAQSYITEHAENPHRPLGATPQRPFPVLNGAKQLNTPLARQAFSTPDDSAVKDDAIFVWERRPRLIGFANYRRSRQTYPYLLTPQASRQGKFRIDYCMHLPLQRQIGKFICHRHLDSSLKTSRIMCSVHRTKENNGSRVV